MVSGRDLQDVARRVGVPGITYAGSHGLDIDIDEGHPENARAEDALPALAQAEEALRQTFAQTDGVSVERKRFSLAVHFRNAAPDAVVDIEQRFADVAAQVSQLKRRSVDRVVTRI